LQKPAQQSTIVLSKNCNKYLSGSILVAHFPLTEQPPIGFWRKGALRLGNPAPTLMLSGSNLDFSRHRIPNF
jgi:hypothetical protein